MRTKYLIAVAIGALTLIPAYTLSRKPELKVLGAVGMRQVMFDLGPAFERATGRTLAMAFDSTGLIAKRIAAGEQVDVVIINRAAVDTLAKDNKVIASTVVDVARSIAAVAVRKGAAKPDISSPEAFKRLLLSAETIARPSPTVGGSSGDHIVQVLERLGIADVVNAKSVFVITGNPGQVAESPGDAVAKGKAEIALHQLQELMAVSGIEIVGPFPSDLQGRFVFSAALGTTAKEVEGGKALIEFLRSRQAMNVIKAKGMEPVTR